MGSLLDIGGVAEGEGSSCLVSCSFLASLAFFLASFSFWFWRRSESASSSSQRDRLLDMFVVVARDRQSISQLA